MQKKFGTPTCFIELNGTESTYLPICVYALYKRLGAVTSLKLNLQNIPQSLAEPVPI